MPFLKNNRSLSTRLSFLRKLIQCNSSVKEAEMVILELLSRATSKDKNRMSLSKLDDNLHAVEMTALWMALAKPSVMQRYNRWFDFLNNADEIPLEISEEEKFFIKNELPIMNLGATASGKKLVGALLDRLQNSGKKSDFEVEHVLPVKRHNKYWKEAFPTSIEREQYMHKLGNLVLVSKKATMRESNQSFDDKKKRYKSESQWQLTQTVASSSKWDETAILKQQYVYIAIINDTWGL
eukprot:CAMPEP_0197836248 /NCGR_PEP_ID=MMETSP1437-20131217/28357_1 /TAXON_ID=49252 ORGANISM="Eucampia antarctica, Strain CCMP1452" /NCGR_SAMPLE_ID=MMETSP1437 /ASSEMBLY_ACC=CAM_ASM_001096 /LENGTH=237 /DNA_ID=CAMNT_0043442277 /DNA_START=123 /DNA_END=836 /DNA_ORIENTATION=-